MFFHQIKAIESDPVFGRLKEFLNDKNPKKVNLTAGVYHDEELKTPYMSSTFEVMQQFTSLERQAGYLPMDGMEKFCLHIGSLAFGKELWEKNRLRTAFAQTLGGTGAITMWALLIQRVGVSRVFLSSPTWANHLLVFRSAGFDLGSYAYYDKKRGAVNFSSLLEDIEKMPNESAVVFHTCCHNPTGSDLSEDEWKNLSKVMKAKKILPLFDFAYQGLGAGIEEDRKPLEIFLQEGHSIAVAYSCSKNFSLYSQRVGALFVVLENEKEKEAVKGNLQQIARAIYSNPPSFGVKVASHILDTASLTEKWKKELQNMQQRLVSLRILLSETLTQCLGKDFSYLKQQRGMFSCFDLELSQIERLKKEFGVYLLNSGRINFAGLCKKNIDYVASSLVQVMS